MKIIHVHFDEYLSAEGIHVVAPFDGHDEVQDAVRDAEDKGFTTVWVHHGFWPKGEVVEYET